VIALPTGAPSARSRSGLGLQRSVSPACLSCRPARSATIRSADLRFAEDACRAVRAMQAPFPESDHLRRSSFRAAIPRRPPSCSRRRSFPFASAATTVLGHSPRTLAARASRATLDFSHNSAQRLDVSKRGETAGWSRITDRDSILPRAAAAQGPAPPSIIARSRSEGVRRPELNGAPWTPCTRYQPCPHQRAGGAYAEADRRMPARPAEAASRDPRTYDCRGAALVEARCRLNPLVFASLWSHPLPSRPRRCGRAAGCARHELKTYGARLRRRAVLAGTTGAGRAASSVCRSFGRSARAPLVSAKRLQHPASPIGPPGAGEQEPRSGSNNYFHTPRGRAGLRTNARDLVTAVALWSAELAFDDATLRTTAARRNPYLVRLVIHSYRHRLLRCRRSQLDADSHGCSPRSPVFGTTIVLHARAAASRRGKLAAPSAFLYRPVSASNVGAPEGRPQPSA